MRLRLLPPLVLLLLAFSFSWAGSDSSRLANQLQLQWEHYDKARNTLLDRLHDESLDPDDRAISRAEWEGILYLGPKMEWTASDLRELRASQEDRIAKARLAAQAQSPIDLKVLRELPPAESKEAIQNFCAELPKGGMLHIHPSGTLDEQTVRDLLETGDPEIPFAELLQYSNDPRYGTLLYPNEVDWLSQQPQKQNYSLLSSADQERYREFFKLPPGSHPFERFDAVFNFVWTSLNTNADLEKAWMDFAKRAVRQKVSYVEFTTGIAAGGLPEIIRILKKIEADTGLVIRLNAAFARTQSVQHNRSRIDELLRLTPNPWIVGIDLLANETHAPALEQAQEIYGRVLSEVLAGRSNLHRTMHSGELGDATNPRDAMIMGTERLGHGVLLWKDPVALEYALQEKIGIEANLTSNLKLGVSQSPEGSHFLKFLRLGLPVSLSTDDEGIFDTDINQECELAVSQTDIEYNELKQLALNGIQTSFADELTRRRLMKALEERFKAFELAVGNTYRSGPIPLAPRPREATVPKFKLIE